MTGMVAAAAVVDGDDPRLGEWLDFHRRVGVERFFLHRAGAAAIVAPDVVDIPWPSARPHRDAAADGLARCGGDIGWLAFLDVEEFLFATDGENLRAALATFGRHPAVGVNRLFFAPPPADGAILRQAVRRAPDNLVLALPGTLRGPGLDPKRHDSYRPLATRVAFVVQPGRTQAGAGRDDFVFADGARAVTEAGGVIEGRWSAQASFERLRVNRYLSAAGESLAERFIGVPPARRGDFAPFRSEIDTAILPIAAGRP